MKKHPRERVLLKSKMKHRRKKCGGHAFTKTEKDEGRRPRIMPYQPGKDQLGRFIDFCDYPFHRGLLPRAVVPMCLERECPHYKRIYLNLGTTETCQCPYPKDAPAGAVSSRDTSD
ncbi:hypothetical protein FJZ17_01675 [Candidatus Pacearchaeota archaeon]|nr:hypothetical protein [Candidatus Pacearchaeota archaeon]